MCMKDLDSFHQMPGISTLVSLTAGTPTLLCDYDESRVSITFLGVDSSFQIQTNPVAADNKGAYMSRDKQPITFDVRTHGQLVHRPFYGWVSSGSVTVMVLEATSR